MATDRQISQLVLQVDAKIAVAQRELQLLARDVRQQTGDINNSLATTEVAHQRMGKAFGQARIAQMELSHVVTASVDAYAAGFSPLRIMTLEMGRLAEAATFLGGSGGSGVLAKLANFMGGPWGIAVLLGVSVLTQLIAKHYAAGDSVDDLVAKMQKEALQQGRSDEAHKIFAQTLGGVDDALKSVEKAYAEYENRLKGSSQVELEAAKKALTIADARRVEAKATLAAAKAEIERQNALALGPETKNARADPRLAAANQARARIEQAESQLSDADGSIARANHDIEKWQSIVTVENAAADAADKIKHKYDGLIETTRKEYLAQHKVGDELARQIDLLKKKEAAELKALETARQTSGEHGKQISFTDAAAIAKGAGLTVTSAYRSTAHQAELYSDPNVRRPGNPVARPGTSAHEGVNGKWALDIAFAPGLTPAKLTKLYGDQGVSLSALYKEKGHFHIEGSRSQAAADEAKAARDAQKQQVDDDTFARESAQIDAQTLAARRQLVAGYDSQASIAAEEVEAERKAAQAAIQKQLDAHQITVDQATLLSLQADEAAAARQAVIARKLYADGLSQAAHSAQQIADEQVADLQFADEMATTQAEHRKVQLAILDIQYDQKKAELERLKMLVQSNKDFSTSLDLQQQAAELQQQINRLPTDKSNDQARVHQGTLNPLEAWAKDANKSAAEVIQAMQSIEAQGLDDLSGSLVDAGLKFLGLADHADTAAGRIIKAILEMTAKMLIFRAISSVLGSAFGGGFDTASFAATESSNAAALGIGGFRAGGGPVSAGKAYVVGERRPELFVPNVSGTIVPSVPRIGVPRRGGDGGPIELIVYTAPSPDAWAQVEVVATNQAVKVTQAAAPALVRASAQSTARALNRPRLMGNGR